MVGILFPILSEGKKMQNLTRYPDAYDNKFLMGALTQFPVSFEFTYRNWKQVHIKHENFLRISLESEQKQGRK